MKRKPATPAKQSNSQPETLVSLHAHEVAEKKAKILAALDELDSAFKVAVDNIQARLRELV